MKIALLAASLALLAGQAIAADDSCKGQVVNIRTSKLKSTDAKAGFDKAVKDNEAWYRSHGVTTNTIVGGTVVNFDRATGMMVAIPGMVTSVHINPPDPRAIKHDAAWDAFVGEYNAASDVVSQTILCLDTPIK